MHEGQNEHFLVLFSREMCKNSLNVLTQHSMHITRGCLLFLSQIHVISPVTRIKLELKLHYIAALKSYFRQMQTRKCLP